MITQGPEGPAPVGDIVGTVYSELVRESTVCRTAAAAVAELPGAGGPGRLPGGSGLVRLGQHHAPAASRRRMAVPQPRPDCLNRQKAPAQGEEERRGCR